MTRKRFVKLLMAEGIGRNEANAAAEIARKNGESYERSYNLMIGAGKALADAWAKIVEIVQESVNTVRVNLAEIIPEALEGDSDGRKPDDKTALGVLRLPQIGDQEQIGAPGAPEK